MATLERHGFRDGETSQADCSPSLRQSLLQQLEFRGRPRFAVMSEPRPSKLVGEHARIAHELPEVSWQVAILLGQGVM
jgi:hypothetical protein